MRRTTAWEGVRLVVPEFTRFGLVGVFNYILDVAVFNLLLFTVLGGAPLVAKAASTTIAATSSYLMNRHWTWRHRAYSGVGRELPLFLMLSAIGLGISLACLGVSHYLLGFTSPLADNIAANVVGLAFATAWRFWSFKRWVFLAADRAVGPEAGREERIC